MVSVNKTHMCSTRLLRIRILFMIAMFMKWNVKAVNSKKVTHDSLVKVILCSLWKERLEENNFGIFKWKRMLNLTTLKIHW